MPISCRTSETGSRSTTATAAGGCGSTGVKLEKLLDLVEARSPEVRIASPEPRRAPDPVPSHQRRDDRDRYDDDRSRGKKRKRKGAFAEMLEEVFEAFD